MKKKTLVMLATSAIIVLSLSACGTGGHMDGAGSDGSELESGYLATIQTLQGEVKSFEQSGNPALDRQNYRSGMMDGLDDMDAMRDIMRERCQIFSDCPANGGATGNLSGENCMWGGRMMNSSQITRMDEYIRNCRDLLNEFWVACGESWADDRCIDAMKNHVGRMNQALNGLETKCQEWWRNSDDTTDDGMGMMESGSHGHWGKCGDNHHERR